jgi:hypothetical protein
MSESVIDSGRIGKPAAKGPLSLCNGTVLAWVAKFETLLRSITMPREEKPFKLVTELANSVTGAFELFDSVDAVTTFVPLSIRKILNS